jgi:hypothetical protein
MQDNPALPGMPTSQRVCGVPGCDAKLYRDNQLGFCGAHRTRKSRTGPRFCSFEGCGQRLHYKNEIGFCPDHARRHAPAVIKREADRLAEKVARQSTWQVCTAEGCTKRLRPSNKSGRCSKHHYVPIDPAERGQCSIEGCGARLSKKNTLGRCEKHMLPRWVAAECAAEGCTKKLNVTNLIGFCGKHTNGYRRDARLLQNYGITEAQYDAMLAAQGGVCVVCGKPPKPGGVGAARCLHVDHDHACCPGKRSCGKCVRALLCQNCNNGLGHFSDDPELLRRAADYIEQYAVVPVAA